MVAFDLFVQMYEEEAGLAFEDKIPKEWIVSREKIPTTILESNLHGIDIDLRSVQLSYLVLYLRMREYQKSVGAPKLLPTKVNLVVADASLLNTPEFLSWCEERFREELYAINIIKGISGRLKNLSEIGSLARPEEDLKELIHREKERLLSAWKKEKAPKQFSLFRQMLTPEQQELPFDKVTDDQFWEGVLSRVTKALDEYYKEASERGDTRAQVFVHEASRGFKFLELCNKRYDVVATNPPYMGSGNMGKELKDYVQRAYPEGKRDLYAAFILRNREWAANQGIVAMVTQHSWMFLESFVKMREKILKENRIQSIAHLGEHAFEDPAAAGAFVALFNLTCVTPNEGHQLVAYNLMAPNTSREKDAFLIRSIGLDIRNIVYRPKQNSFIQIPNVTIVYWLSSQFLELLINESKLDSLMYVVEPSTTGDNERFFRYRWEVTNPERWFASSKGGGYCKWCGFDSYVIDWENEGKRIKSFSGSFIRNEKYMFLPGLTFTQMCRGSMSVRLLPKNGTFGKAGPGIFPKRISPYSLLGILNSRLTSYFLRSVNTKLTFSTGSLLILPQPKHFSEILETLGKVCLIHKQKVISSDLIEYEFEENNIGPASPNSIIAMYKCSSDDLALNTSLLHTYEGIIESEVNYLYGLMKKEVENITDDLGTPAGWYPLIEGYDVIPEADICKIPGEVTEYLGRHERVKPREEELTQIKFRLRSLYEAGGGAKVEKLFDEEEREPNSDEEEGAESIIGKRIPIPTETFIEELSVKMEIHPVSIYWLLKEMRKKEGVVCWPECKGYVEDYFTVMILRMLGFRWPKQIEANESVPDWADKDGIIPITEHTEEKTLLERIRDRIGAEFGEDRIADIESEFADILYNTSCKEAEIKGKTPPKKKMTLGQWLEKEFFKRHTSQFKKRPIAWHITSSNGTFQVLIFCHKISLDMIKNLKNRHLARVQSYYGSLLEKARRGESVPGGLTAGKLSDIGLELEEFSNKLDKLIAMPYEPLIDDGVRVNIAPLQKLGLLSSPVLAAKDVDRAIADRNRWREDDKEQNTIWRLT